MVRKATKKKSTRVAGDAKLTRAAQNKATLSAYLSENPGEHSVAEAAEATGLSKGTTGQHLAHMANEGLIPPMRKQGNSRFYQWKGNALLETAPERVTATRRAYTKRKITGTAKEVEFVINGAVVRVGVQNGTMVSIGRNETGQVRITLEDGA